MPSRSTKKLGCVGPDTYQEFFTPDSAPRSWDDCEPEFEPLQASYDLPPFPLLDLESRERKVEALSGSGAGPEQEIDALYDQISRRIGFRFERLAEIGWLIRRSVPGAGVLIVP